MLAVRLTAAPLAALVAALTTILGADLAAQTCTPPAHPRIAEVLYDAVGDDTGHEFVELFNPTALTLSLAGARLEAGDGSGPGRWTTRWTGAASDSVLPGNRFVIGGALVDPAPHALATLDLQNGPDGLRLVWPDGAIEVVGYGALEFPEYACGDPTVDVASGQALARIPDDADFGSNALDFRAAPPTPGRANQSRRDVAWVAGATRAAPLLAAPGAPVRLAGVLENRGTEPIPAGSLSWVVREAGVAPELAAGMVAVAMAPSDTMGMSVEILNLAPGKRRLLWVASLSGDEAPGNDRDSLWVRIGAGPLRLTEIQFHPAAGEGEWVEVVNAEDAPLDLDAYGFADRAGHPGHPSPGGMLAPDSLAVLAQDRAALLARFPELDTLRVVRVSPWPSLNNSDDATGVADVASVLEADGTPCDQLAYSAAGVPAGVPLERDGDGLWSPSPVAGGTPLAPPRPRAAVAGRFEVEPRRVRASGGEARLRWDLPWPRARVACVLYDLAGRPRGQVLAETAVAGRGELRWAPRDLPVGLYLVVLRARAESGEGSLAVTRPIRVEAR